MLRVLHVDYMPPHVLFCDDELQAFFTETNGTPWQGVLQSLHGVATGLQKCFLSRPLQQSLHGKISEAQEDIYYCLRKEIEYFQGKETQLLQDWPLEGPGAFARKFISLVLPLLQAYPAEVCVDAAGIISIDSLKYQSSYHIISVLPHGVEFDFRESINTPSSLFIKWKELVSLTQLGISFVLMKPQEFPLSERFGHACTNGKTESILDGMCSLETVTSIPKLGEQGRGGQGQGEQGQGEQGQEEQGWVFLDWQLTSAEI
jgi:hypothetical protein